MFRILVVEDDRIANRVMCACLRANGYEAIAAYDGEEALDRLDTEHVDLMVADVMMPRLDGYTLTNLLREGGSTLPILMVTARDRQEDKHRGFLVGTDDYMTKPVDRTELLYRIRALLRRARIVDEQKITLGPVTLHYNSLTVTRGDDEQTLPPKEFYLLYKLLAYPGQVFTRLQLLDEIWGLDSESDAGTVNVHISRLRKRFEGYPEFELVSVRGLGYKAVKHVD
ncbi:MAG: response regulator transcription factor [Aristaeellaceae bacterium]